MSAVEYQNQDVEINELQHSLTTEDVENNNSLFVQSSQLLTSPMEDPSYLFDGEDCSNQEFYYYYNNPLILEEQALLGITNNNEIYDNQVITWSPELELQNSYIINSFPYLYNDGVENDYDNLDTYNPYNPFIEQQSHDLGNNLLLTQPLSEVTQNVIENQQFNSYNWCDLSPFSDTQQQYIIENNDISSKITEQHISSENYYTDFQLLEA